MFAKIYATTGFFSSFEQINIENDIFYGIVVVKKLIEFYISLGRAIIIFGEGEKYEWFLERKLNERWKLSKNEIIQLLINKSIQICI